MCHCISLSNTTVCTIPDTSNTVQRTKKVLSNRIKGKIPYILLNIKLEKVYCHALVIFVIFEMDMPYSRGSGKNIQHAKNVIVWQHNDAN